MARFSLILVFSNISYVIQACSHGSYGGQCVQFARNSFGKDKKKMPGLCKFNRDCGAYNAYKNWDLGHGKGKEPHTNSIMVIAKQKDLPLGHIAKVKSIFIDSYGVYQMKVDESNWTLDENMSCDVHYSYNPRNNKVKRYGGKEKTLAGFIYSVQSREADPYDTPILFKKELSYKREISSKKSIRKTFNTSTTWDKIKKSQKRLNNQLQWNEFNSWSTSHSEETSFENSF